MDSGITDPGIDPLIGQRIGNYELESELGAGGMGEVYLGRHTVLGRPAAIKVLRHKYSREQDIVRRFFNEARAAAAIDHPGIVDILDVGHTADRRAYLIMEYLRGSSLADHIDENGRMTVPIAVDVIEQCARALQAAHVAGIIHRDLKPENIFLSPDPSQPSGFRAKILDFGIAKLAGSNPSAVRTSTGMIMGTPLYMSPEQCRGAGHIDVRTDIYSLACVLFHTLVGRPPFTDEAVGELIASHLKMAPPRLDSIDDTMPPALVSFTAQCLSKKAADRPTTMSDVASFLGNPTLRGFIPTGPPTEQTSMAPLERTPSMAGSFNASPRMGATEPRAQRPRAELEVAKTQASSPLSDTGQQDLKRDIAVAMGSGRAHSTAMPPRKSKVPWIVASAVVVLGCATAIAVSVGGGSDDTDSDEAAAAAAAAEAEAAAAAAAAATPDAAPAVAIEKPVVTPVPVPKVKVTIVARPRGTAIRETKDGPILSRNKYVYQGPADEKPKTFHLSRRGYTDQTVEVAVDGNGRFNYRLDRAKTKKRPTKNKPPKRDPGSYR